VKKIWIVLQLQYFVTSHSSAWPQCTQNFF